MSNYPVPPPSYGQANTQKSTYHSVDDTREPLLGSSSRGGGGGIYDQPSAGELPDDFKVRFFRLLCLYVIFPILFFLSFSMEYLSQRALQRSVTHSFAKYTLSFVSLCDILRSINR